LTNDTARAVERVARLTYGRLVAMLASRSGDVAGAEDALSDALSAALMRWPVDGVPDNPDAWLMTAAKRAAGHRRARVATAAAGEGHLMLIIDERAADTGEPFGDARLRLMFACTHPAIARDVQTPLILQTVLGINAARIAAAFLMSPAAMGQKLVRAKLRIKGAGIGLTVPDAAQIGARKAVLCDAIYAAFGTGWDDAFASDAARQDLSDEAIWLGRLLVDLLPDDPEVMGLLALMLHCDARKAARRSADGRYVPLDQQDMTLWSTDSIAEAEALIMAAARFGQPGRYQIEAAIQSLHVAARRAGRAPGRPLATLYDHLIAIAPSVGAQVARALAHGEAGDPAAGLAMIAEIDASDYQPLAVARARLLWLSGEEVAAWDAARLAAGLASDPAVRDFVLAGGIFDQRH
jgi:predicted RNA polymerase sigma factor